MKTKIKSLILTAFLICYYLFCHSQTNQNKAVYFQKDSAIANRYLNEIKLKIFSTENLDSMFLKVKNIIDTLPNCETKLNYYSTASFYYLQTGDAEKTTYNINQGLEICKEIKIKKYETSLKFNAASLKCNAGLYSQSLKEFIELDKSLDTSMPKYHYFKQKIYNSMFLCSMHTFDTVNALQYLKVLEKNCKSIPDTIEFLLEKNRVFYSAKETDYGIKLSQKLQIIEAELDFYNCHLNHFIEIKDNLKSIDIITKIMSLSNNEKLIRYYYLAIFKLGKINYFNGEYNLALSNFNNVISQANSTVYKNYLFEIIYYKTMCFEKLKRYKDAYQNYKIYDSMKTNLVGIEKQKIVSQLNIQYDVNKKQQEINQKELKNKLQQQTIIVEKKQKNILTTLFLIALGLLAFTIYNFIKKNKLSRKLMLSNIEIEKQANDLNKSNATKDKLFTIIAHDLRSPINSYQGLGNTISYLIKKQNFDEINAIANKIDETGHSLNSLLNNLLNWSLSEQQRLSTTKTTIILDRFYEEILPIYEQQAKNKHLHFNTKISKGTSIHASNILLSIIVRNLLDNAIKYATPDSEILFSSMVVENNFQLSISNATNIKDDVFEKIKTLFDSSENALPNENGFGIGLILVKQSLREMNGKIKISYKNNNVEILISISTF